MVQKLKVSLEKKFRNLRTKFLERDFLNMNSKQKEAVFNVNGPVIVLAGAGSGKTTAIINRIINMVNYGNAYMSKGTPSNLTEGTVSDLETLYNNGNSAESVKDILCSRKIDPGNILTITFTNKAANELKLRLSEALGEKGNEIWASTFHSLCSRILRMHAELIGFTNHFVVYDDDDAKKLIKECEKNLYLDDKMLTHKTIKYEISRAKDKLLEPEEYKQRVGNDFRLVGVASIYELYQRRLKELDAMDFDDLIVNTVKLFQNFPDILEKYQNKFKYIMVDEYQDTNYAQYVLIKLLADKYKNLCVVGDDDQSIYKFRGATIENIIDFEKFFPGAKIIRLEQNYRSTKNILNAANAVISNNSNRKGKTLWTQNDEGEKIKAHTAYSEHDEANYIAETVKKLVEGGEKYSDSAILYRMNSQSNVIEKVFMKSGIPYRILGGLRFYERKEIKDMIAYLSIINNPKDEIRLKRIINQPRRSIGERTISQATEIARKFNEDFLNVLRKSDTYENLQRVSIKLKSFSDLIDSLIKANENPEIKIHDLYDMILDKTGYIDYLKTDNDNSEVRIENVKELLSNIKKYEEDAGENATLAGFLEEVALLSDIDNYDENSDAVVMMTLHSAKGLEFPTVFIPGFEEGIFPGIQSMSSDEDIEEERRLAYVGITRSKNKLYILNSGSRMIFGSTSHNKVSRFLDEIPSDLIEKTKSRDWKDLKKGERIPRSAQEIRARSIFAARNFGGVSGGVSGNNIVNDYKVGDIVKHTVFGIGTIVYCIKMGNDSMLSIDFGGNIGIKKLMANFAKLTKQ